jgi:hypothetical protein
MMSYGVESVRSVLSGIMTLLTLCCRQIQIIAAILVVF